MFHNFFFEYAICLPAGAKYTTQTSVRLGQNVSHSLTARKTRCHVITAKMRLLLHSRERRNPVAENNFGNVLNNVYLCTIFERNNTKYTNYTKQPQTSL